MKTTCSSLTSLLLLGTFCGSLTGHAVNKSAPTVEQTVPVAEPTDAAAQFQQARAYMRGDGVEQDYTKALPLMQKAAAQGYAEAEGGLGYLYSEGLGVDKDEKQAVQWFQKAADQGSAKGQFNLGRMLIAGRGTPQDSKKGIALVQKAAEQNLPEAQYVYGEALYLGKFGVTRDRELAFQWTAKAAEAGITSAQNLAGLIRRDGMNRDLAVSESWFRKAALQGDLKAQSNLGHLLFRQPNSRDRKIEGLKWLMIAERVGEPLAVKTLEEVGPGLPHDDLAEARKQASDFRPSARRNM